MSEQKQKPREALCRPENDVFAAIDLLVSALERIQGMNPQEEMVFEGTRGKLRVSIDQGVITAHVHADGCLNYFSHRITRVCELCGNSPTFAAKCIRADDPNHVRVKP